MPNLDEAIRLHTEVFGWRVLHRETNEEQGVEEAMLGTGEQGRRSFREIKTYRRKKRWSS